MNKFQCIRISVIAEAEKTIRVPAIRHAGSQSQQGFGRTSYLPATNMRRPAWLGSELPLNPL